MTRLFLAAACVAAAAIFTSSAVSASSQQTPDQACAMEGAWADIIMGFRQIGTPIGETLKRAGPSRRAMVLAAYEVPRFALKENEDQATADFSNDWQLACYKRE